MSAGRLTSRQIQIPAGDLDDILREPDAARFLKTTSSALRTARCRGSASCPPYFKRGASIFYSKTVLCRWLAEGAVSPATSSQLLDSLNLPKTASDAGDL